MKKHAIPLEFDVRLAEKLEPPLSNALKTELDNTATRDEQKKLWEGLVNLNIKDILTSSLVAVSNFNFTEIENSNIINWKDVIESIEVHAGFAAVLPTPAPPNKPILPPFK